MWPEGPRTINAGHLSQDLSHRENYGTVKEFNGKDMDKRRLVF